MNQSDFCGKSLIELKNGLKGLNEVMIEHRWLLATGLMNESQCKSKR